MTTFAYPVRPGWRTSTPRSSRRTCPSFQMATVRVAQRDVVRAEFARNAALGAVAPLLLLVPLSWISRAAGVADVDAAVVAQDLPVLPDGDGELVLRVLVGGGRSLRRTTLVWMTALLAGIGLAAMVAAYALARIEAGPARPSRW
jgi:hypothetical protein